MILVRDITRERTASGAELRATVQCKDTSLDGTQIWFRYPHEYYEYITETANPWIPALVMTAMGLGKPLRVEAPASARLLRGAETFMEIMHQWRPEYAVVEVEASRVMEASSPGCSVGCFFSGGVDSFYTVLKDRASSRPPDERISHLLFVHGFDIALRDKALYDTACQHLAASAQDLGVSLVPCSTNLREVADTFADWNMAHGQLLIAVSYGVERLWQRIIIPASYSYAELFPWGSHPLIDPLWSTEAIEIVHDGAEATRAEKVLRQIAQSDIALRHLRVCWENRDGKYNCGQCEKCVRTMVNLKIAGALDKCSTFDRGLTYAAIANVNTDSKGAKIFVSQNIQTGQAANCDPRVIRALKRSLSPWRRLRRLGVRRIARACAIGLLKPIDRILFGGRLRENHRKRHQRR